MSSSGQAPNVSMDDLLASIKNMIEGESNGGANSPNNAQGDGGMGAQGAAPMNDGMQGNAMDDGIMDLTQVVRPSHAPQNPQHAHQSQPEQRQADQSALQQSQGMGHQGDAGGMNMGGTAQEAAAELNNLFNGFGNDSAASAQNMMGGDNILGGDIGLPADGGADFASLSDAGNGVSESMMGEEGAADFGASVEKSSSDGSVDHMDQMSRDGLFGGAMSGQNNGGQNSGQNSGMNAEGQGGMMPAQNPAQGQGQGQAQGQLNANQMNPALGNQGPGNQGVGNRGIAGPAPAPHSPAPVPQNSQHGGGLVQAANMGAMGQNPAALQGGMQAMGGQMPQGQHMPQGPQGQQMPQGQQGQPMLQGQQGQMSSQGQGMPGQVPHPQAQNPQLQNAPMPGQAMGQMPNQTPMAGQNPGQQAQNYQPMAQGLKGGEALGGHDPRLESEIAMGQALSQADASLNLSALQSQNEMLAQQQEQMRQMQQQPVSAVSNGDGLPVLSGFRPVLPAVQEEPYVSNNPDQLPVEMRNNLEDIIKQLLKPMLRDWLDRNLPELLKDAVDEETGKIDPNRW